MTSFAQLPIFDNIHILVQACHEILTSDLFQQFLTLVLTLANFMNGTRNRQYGFKLGSLIKLNDTRSTDGSGITLLMYLIQWIERDYSHLLSLEDELTSCASASKIILASVKEQVKKIKGEVDDIDKQIQKIQGTIDGYEKMEQTRVEQQIKAWVQSIMERIDSEENDTVVPVPDIPSKVAPDRYTFDTLFLAKMRDFHKKAVVQVQAMETELEKLNDLLTQLSVLYNEPDVTSEPEKFFSVIDRFLNMYKSAIFELKEKQKQIEERKIRKSRSAANLQAQAEIEEPLPTLRKSRKAKPLQPMDEIIIQISSPKDNPIIALPVPEEPAEPMFLSIPRSKSFCN